MNNYLNISNTDFETWSHIKKHPIFLGIVDEEIKLILPFFKQVHLQLGEFLVQQGLDISTELYLVLDGNLEVMKEAAHESDIKNKQNRFVVARLNSGDIIGELSFLKAGIRSASIRSTSKSNLLSLLPDDMRRLEADYPAVSTRFMKNMLIYMGHRLSVTSANEVKALKVELENSALNSKASMFFSYIIGLLCVYNLAIHEITNLSLDASKTSIISTVIIVLFSLVMILMIWQNKLPTRIFGLTLKNWKPAVRESALWSLAIVGVLIGVKWLLIHNIAGYSHLPLFNADLIGEKYLAFNFVLYGLHAPIQEFIARGVLQGGLQHFFTGRNIVLRAVIISNALFSATHVHLMGGWLGFFVFAPGLFWGWLYSRHQNLLGVSISHILIGWTALFLLDIQSLF